MPSRSLSKTVQTLGYSILIIRRGATSTFVAGMLAVVLGAEVAIIKESTPSPQMTSIDLCACVERYFAESCDFFVVRKYC